MRWIALLMCVASCSPALDVDAGSGGGGGGGGGAGGGGAAGTGGGGGSSAMDAALRRGEGESCQQTSDCVSGLQCVNRVTGSGAGFVCSSCMNAGDACGDAGRCVAVATSSGATVSCSFGGPGEPCSSNADCRSNDCQQMVTAGGVTRACR